MIKRFEQVLLCGFIGVSLAACTAQTPVTNSSDDTEKSVENSTEEVIPAAVDGSAVVIPPQ